MSDETRRLLSYVMPEPNTGCWLVTLAEQRGGYAHFAVDGRYTSAHRASWLLHGGANPEGLDVLHRCDTPSCVNPDHLWLGSHADNMRDRQAKGRARGDFQKKDTCVRGHDLTDTSLPVRFNPGGRPTRQCRQCNTERVRRRRQRRNEE